MGKKTGNKFTTENRFAPLGEIRDQEEQKKVTSNKGKKRKNKINKKAHKKKFSETLSEIDNRATYPSIEEEFVLESLLTDDLAKAKALTKRIIEEKHPKIADDLIKSIALIEEQIIAALNGEEMEENSISAILSQPVSFLKNMLSSVSELEDQKKLTLMLASFVGIVSISSAMSYYYSNHNPFHLGYITFDQGTKLTNYAMEEFNSSMLHRLVGYASSLGLGGIATKSFKEAFVKTPKKPNLDSSQSSVSWLGSILSSVKNIVNNPKTQKLTNIAALATLLNPTQRNRKSGPIIAAASTAILGGGTPASAGRYDRNKKKKRKKQNHKESPNEFFNLIKNPNTTIDQFQSFIKNNEHLINEPKPYKETDVTPLMYCAFNKKFGFFKTLINHPKIDINKTTKDGETALLQIFRFVNTNKGYSDVSTFFIQPLLEKTDLLIENIYGVDLYEYAEEFEVQGITELILKKIKETPLENLSKKNLNRLYRHALYQEKDINTVNTVLPHLKNLNTPIIEGDTELHIAIKQNDIKKIAELYESNNFDVNAQNSNGNTPLHLVLKNIKNKNEQILNQILPLILRHNINPLIENNEGETSLMLTYNVADKLSDEHIIDRIINLTTDINYQNKNGDTILHYSISKLNQYHLELLLDEYLFKEKLNFNIKNNAGKSAFNLIKKLSYYNTKEKADNFNLAVTIASNDVKKFKQMIALNPKLLSSIFEFNSTLYPPLFLSILYDSKEIFDAILDKTTINKPQDHDNFKVNNRHLIAIERNGYEVDPVDFSTYYGQDTQYYVKKLIEKGVPVLKESMLNARRRQLFTITDFFAQQGFKEKRLSKAEIIKDIKQHRDGTDGIMHETYDFITKTLTAKYPHVHTLPLMQTNSFNGNKFTALNPAIENLKNDKQATQLNIPLRIQKHNLDNIDHFTCLIIIKKEDQPLQAFYADPTGINTMPIAIKEVLNENNIPVTISKTMFQYEVDMGLGEVDPFITPQNENCGAYTANIISKISSGRWIYNDIGRIIDTKTQQEIPDYDQESSLAEGNKIRAKIAKYLEKTLPENTHEIDWEELKTQTLNKKNNPKPKTHEGKLKEERKNQNQHQEL